MTTVAPEPTGDDDPARQLLGAVTAAQPEAPPRQPARIPAGVREPATATDWLRALGRRHRL